VEEEFTTKNYDYSMIKKYYQLTNQRREIPNKCLLCLQFYKSFRLLVRVKKSQVFTLVTGTNGRVQNFFISFVHHM